MKQCTKCKKLLPEIDFHKHKGGLKSRCKQCRKKSRKQYYKEHSNVERERTQHWRQTHKKELKDYDNKRYHQNKEKELIRS